MDAHTELLARVQFAFTIGLHIVFPALSIGLSAFVATLLVLALILASVSSSRSSRARPTATR
jgi:cytochrome bd-type quinol oxidase subunit 1